MNGSQALEHHANMCLSISRCPWDVRTITPRCGGVKGAVSASNGKTIVIALDVSAKGNMST